MPRNQWNDGEEVVSGDLSGASSVLEMELYDRLIYELMNRQQNVAFGDSFTVSNVNTTTSQVKLGNGVYYDSTQVNPEPKTRLLYIAGNTNVTHTAADGSHDRIDLVVITPARTNLTTATRNTKDAVSGAVTGVSQVVQTDWLSTLAVVAGTPSASPAAPATPAGSLVLAQVLVTTTSGISGAGAYTDKRSRFQKTSSYGAVRSIAASATADSDDETIFCNATSGAIVLTLPLASTVSGKRFTILKTDSTGNTVTVQGDTISDASTQVLSNQFGSMSVRSNGAQYYML